jgi:hypothetical protein
MNLIQHHKLNRILCVITIFAILMVNVSCAGPSADTPASGLQGTAAQVEASDSERFAEVAQDVFAYIASENSIGLNYFVAHPEDYDITPPPIPTLGEYSRAYFEKEEADIKQQVERLEQINKDALTGADRVTYDVLYAALSAEDDSEDLLYFNDPLRPSEGVHAALPIELAEFHLRTADFSHPAVFITGKFRRVCKQFKINALLAGVVDLFRPGRHLFFPSAVHDGYGIGAQTQRAARGVHGDIAAAYDDDTAHGLDRGSRLFLKSAHHIDPS